MTGRSATRSNGNPFPGVEKSFTAAAMAEASILEGETESDASRGCALSKKVGSCRREYKTMQKDFLIVGEREMYRRVRK